jgi:hypothetical protein
MFTCWLASDPGSPDVLNEDYAAACGPSLVVLDGLTTRTPSGCRHGAPWYVAQLARAILANLDRDPAEALEVAIARTAESHRSTCDLSNPATPSAAVAILRCRPDVTQYLVLADTTIILDGHGGCHVVTDTRMNQSAPEERALADAYPVGSNEKQGALIRMKHVELRARNTPGGYWVAAADPAVVDHSVTGSVPTAELARAALLTDGAARLVTLFQETDWPGALDLLDVGGPARLIREVRDRERSDPAGVRWPRNKGSDDATAAYVTLAPGSPGAS